MSGALTGLDLPEAYPETVDARTVEQRIADRRAADEFNAAGYSEALGGVPAAARLYAPADLTQFYSVVAVRAALSPLLPIDFVDPAPLGIEKPSTEFVMVGDVSCLVGWAVIPAGEEPTDADRQWVMCQATDDDVTVRINANTGETPETSQSWRRRSSLPAPSPLLAYRSSLLAPEALLRLASGPVGDAPDAPPSGPRRGVVDRADATLGDVGPQNRFIRTFNKHLVKSARRPQRQPRPGATSRSTVSTRCALYSTPSWFGTVSRTVSAAAIASSLASCSTSTSGSAA